MNRIREVKAKSGKGKEKSEEGERGGIIQRGGVKKEVERSAISSNRQLKRVGPQ